MRKALRRQRSCRRGFWGLHFFCAGATEGWTWCLTPVKALIFRRGAPRHWYRPVLRRDGRGASLPAKPYSFVAGHHVIGAGRCYGGMDVVLHSPQSLILSPRGTTSLEPAGASEGWTWCLTPVKALILRHEAPRRWDRRVLRRDGRGASHPSKL